VTDHLSNHVLGLVIYTFENLLDRGGSLINLMKMLGKCFPDLPLMVFRAIFCESPGLDASSFKHMDWSTLSAEFETGTIARFQAQNHQETREATILLRVVLNATGTDPSIPNYLLLSLSAEYVATHPQQVLQEFLSFSREAFNRLGAIYGYANMGTLSNFDGEASKLDPPLALSPVGFQDLSTWGDIHDVVPGVFWANLLSGRHVDLLGGPEHIAQIASCFKTERLLRGGMLLVAGPSPLARVGEVDPSTLGSLFNLLMSLDHSESAVPVLQDDSAEREYRETGFQRMKAHVRRFDEEYLKVGKLPRNHVWRPYRFCVQDVVIGLVVVCHSLENNCLEVDVCLTSDVPEYEPGSGARMTGAFLLSEAYKCGGTMEIRFSEYVEGGRVPAALCRLARDLGVELNHVADGRITPSESRHFYMALTGFSPALHDRIIALSRQRRLSEERACYVVHHGVWTCPEVELIVFGSHRPDSIFSGDTLPEQRHLYMQDILHARAAILGGFLDRKLAKRDRVEGDVAIDLEDDTRRLDIMFDPVFYAKVYQCDEDMPVPWLKDQSQGQEIVPAGHRLIALVRARDASDFNLHFQQDMKVASELVESLRQQSVPARIFILTSCDFEQSSLDVRDRLLATARARGVGVMVCPETITSLDTDASRRLASSRILRQ
jgi:hypothetical protein